jgi:hypothetical protein
VVNPTSADGETATELLGAEEPVKNDKTFSSLDSLVRYLSKAVDFCYRPLEESKTNTPQQETKILDISVIVNQRTMVFVFFSSQHFQDVVSQFASKLN